MVLARGGISEKLREKKTQKLRYCFVMRIICCTGKKNKKNWKTGDGGIMTFL